MFLLTLVFASISLTSAKLPLGWKACRMSSPDFQKCLKDETQKAMRTLIHGERSLGFPSLEPYSVPNQIIEKSSGPVAIILNATDVHFTGVGKAIITDFENQNWNKLILKVYFPGEMDMFANYFLSGKLFNIPLKTSGKLQFTTGERSLGFPSLEPYSVPNQIIEKSSGPVAIILNATDVHFTGVGKAIITDFENQNWNKLILKVYFPGEMDMFANYFLSGKLFNIPLKTSGKLQFTTVNTSTIYEVYLEQEERHGKKYLLPKHVDIDFEPMKVLLKFSTSFKDNKVLEEALNRVANNNWKLILEELRPSLRKGNSDGVVAYLYNIFKNVPLEEFVIN